MRGIADPQDGLAGMYRRSPASQAITKPRRLSLRRLNLRVTRNSTCPTPCPAAATPSDGKTRSAARRRKTSRNDNHIRRSRHGERPFSPRPAAVSTAPPMGTAAAARMSWHRSC